MQGKRIQLRAALLMVAMLALVVASPVAAQKTDGDPVAVPSLVETLTALAGGVLTGAVASLILERLAWFQDITAKARWWVIFAFTVSTPVLAKLLLDFVPASAWMALEPYWQSLGFGLVAWASTQATHVLDKLGIKLGDILQHVSGFDRQ